MFLSQTKFTLLSATIDDDGGFPRLFLRFNTSNDATLTCRDPRNEVLFNDSYFYGIHNESIYLGEYRTSPLQGTYIISARDSSKNIVYTRKFQFEGADLSIVSVQEKWWKENSAFSLVGLSLFVENTGDLPEYPLKIVVQNGSSAFEAVLTPLVILPYQSSSISCFVHLTNFSDVQTTLTISLYGKKGQLLAQTFQAVVPSDSIPSWEFQWYYHGSNTLKIPNMSWFADYYKNIPRFNLLDYAAYVFDPFDDQYISFVADRLLTLPNAPEVDPDCVDFIASFVQAFKYVIDDPLNESYEYPRYPLETMMEQGGDCEDKAILTAALLDSLGYNVSLLRLPNHMAVGVRLPEKLSAYSPYVDQYYFLETTVLPMPLGKVPPEYQGLSNVTVYPIVPRSLLLHTWKNATRYQTSNGADYVTVTLIIENVGSTVASDIEIRGAFYDDGNTSYNMEEAKIPFLPPTDRSMASLTIDVPSSIKTTLKTCLLVNGQVADHRESTMRFP